LIAKALGVGYFVAAVRAVIEALPSAPSSGSLAMHWRNWGCRIRISTDPRSWRRSSPMPTSHGESTIRAFGQMLEVGVDPYVGAPCTNMWRKLITGEVGLQRPVPSTKRDASFIHGGTPRPRFFNAGWDGTLRDSDGNMW